MTLVNRFHAGYTVDHQTGCWLWFKARSDKGYGSISVGSRKEAGGRRERPAHRVSWELVNGPIKDGLFVCHKCDRKACVNPEHLFLGTAQANSADMTSKGRSAHGTRHPLAKLSDAAVIQIRSGAYSRKELAIRFGVNRSTIDRVCLGQSWRHITANAIQDALGIKEQK